MISDELLKFIQAVGPTAALALLGCLGLWKLLGTMQRRMDKMGERIGEIEQARIADYKQIIEPHTRAMNRLSTAIETSPCGKQAGNWLRKEV